MIDGVDIDPREVVRQGLMRHRAAAIFAHNHTTGVAEPSAADRSITIKPSKALALFEIRVPDHLVIARGETVLFAECRLL